LYHNFQLCTFHDSLNYYALQQVLSEFLEITSKSIILLVDWLSTARLHEHKIFYVYNKLWRLNVLCIIHLENLSTSTNINFLSMKK